MCPRPFWMDICLQKGWLPWVLGASQASHAHSGMVGESAEAGVSRQGQGWRGLRRQTGAT